VATEDLAAANRTEPVLTAIADRMYQAAISTQDPGLRTWNLKLARTFLDEAAGISLADYSVRRSDHRDLARGIGQLDGARRNSLLLGDQFIACFQHRFGFNPVGNP
jgi:hypothetical protein